MTLEKDLKDLATEAQKLAMKAEKLLEPNLKEEEYPFKVERCAVCGANTQAGKCPKAGVEHRGTKIETFRTKIHAQLNAIILTANNLKDLTK